MRSRAAFLLSVSCAIVGCGGRQASVGSDSEEVTSKLAPLTDEDFRRPVDKAFLRNANRYLSDAAFEKKWAASNASPVMFMRAYPGGYHEDLVQVPPTRIPGKEDLCLGDAHPDNFGFIDIGGKARFAYNDLDDSGYCPVLLDAARYFAVLRLYFDDKDLSRDLLEQYVETVSDPSRAQTLDASLVPDMTSRRAQKLADAMSGDRLVLGAGLIETAPAERAAIQHIVDTDARFEGSSLLDVATMQRDEGGSGGLRRYRLLLARPAGRTIVELKEAATPGTELGRHSKTLRMDERLGVLKSAFWNTDAADDYFYVKLEGATFLVRDQLAKRSIKLSDLDKKQLAKVLATQVSLMAVLHTKALEGVKKDDVREWLKETSHLLADRWSHAMDVGRVKSR